MTKISKTRLLKRNVSLLLDFYNYTPERYIDVFGIPRHLDYIYDMFHGERKPNKKNLPRISRILNIPVQKLSTIHNLVPLVIKTDEQKWDISDDQYARDHGIPVDQIKRWKRVPVVSKLDIKFMSDAFGVSQDMIKQMTSIKYYLHPASTRSDVSSKLRKIMLVSIKRAKFGIKMLGQSMEDPHSWSNDFGTWDVMQESIKQLRDMAKVVGDLDGYRLARKIYLLSRDWYRCPTAEQLQQKYEGRDIFYNKQEREQYEEYERRYHLNLNNCIHVDKLLDKLAARYESKRKYEYATSRKYCVIAGANLTGDDCTTSRVDYLIYGLKQGTFEDKLTTYDRTVPGLANLDPEWQRLTYEDGLMSDYFGVYGFHKMNQYIRRCSLSRQQLREVVTMLRDQGLSYAKILPCDQIDYWLNCHNAEYREKGDEEA